LRLARRGYRVLYVEQMAGLEHLWRYPALRRRRRGQKGLRQVEQNLWALSPPPLLPGRYYARQISRVNAAWVARWLKPYLERLGFEAPILWVYKPEHVDLIGRIAAQFCVYHCIDEWPAGTTGRKRRIIAALDAELASRADLVFANSPPIFEKKRRLNPNTHRLPSGVDLDHFGRAASPGLPIHSAIRSIPAPRIGYCGTINERLDYALLEQIAASHPEWSLIFVGDPYPWTMDAPPLRRLASHPNVFFPGKVSFQEMPAILAGMDVCLLPYVRDERGHYRSPLKLYEYLAAGKPVVSLAHPEASEFGPVIWLADTFEAFQAGITCALTENTLELAQLRRDRVAAHSWEARVDVIEQRLKSLLGNEVR